MFNETKCHIIYRFRDGISIEEIESEHLAGNLRRLLPDGYFWIARADCDGRVLAMEAFNEMEPRRSFIRVQPEPGALITVRYKDGDIRDGERTVVETVHVAKWTASANAGN